MSNTFTCAVCHQTFSKGWSDEEAIAEGQALGMFDQGPVDVACDDCYQEVMAWAKSEGLL